MIIAAIVIGLVTAYYFGLQAGGYAAVASVALFAVAFLLPSVRFYAYGLVTVGIVGVVTMGPKRQKPGASRELIGWVRKTAFKLWRKAN